MTEVLSENTMSNNNLVKAISVEAAFQRDSTSMFLQILVKNKSQIMFSDFAIKFNIN